MRRKQHSSRSENDKPANGTRYDSAGNGIDLLVGDVVVCSTFVDDVCLRKKNHPRRNRGAYICNQQRNVGGTELYLRNQGFKTCVFPVGRHHKSSNHIGDKYARYCKKHFFDRTVTPAHSEHPDEQGR